MEKPQFKLNLLILQEGKQDPPMRDVLLSKLKGYTELELFKINVLE